jgi:hypothetical protein
MCKTATSSQYAGFRQLAFSWTAGRQLRAARFSFKTMIVFSSDQTPGFSCQLQSDEVVMTGWDRGRMIVVRSYHAHVGIPGSFETGESRFRMIRPATELAGAKSRVRGKGAAGVVVAQVSARVTGCVSRSG